MRLGLAAFFQAILGFGECFYPVRHWMAVIPCCLLKATSARISHLGMQAGVLVLMWKDYSLMSQLCVCVIC